METAEEAVEPAELDINELCTDMFEKMSVFLQGELTGLSPTIQSRRDRFYTIASVHLCALMSLPAQGRVRTTACWRT